MGCTRPAALMPYACNSKSVWIQRWIFGHSVRSASWKARLFNMNCFLNMGENISVLNGFVGKGKYKAFVFTWCEKSPSLKCLIPVAVAMALIRFVIMRIVSIDQHFMFPPLAIRTTPSLLDMLSISRSKGAVFFRHFSNLDGLSRFPSGLSSFGTSRTCSRHSLPPLSGEGT